MVAEVDFQSIFVVSQSKVSSENVLSTLGMSNMSRTPPQVRVDETNRSLDHIRDYGENDEISSLIERLNRDGQGGLQIYSTTISVDIDDDAEDESQVLEERLDINSIRRILLRIESSN